MRIGIVQIIMLYGDILSNHIAIWLLFRIVSIVDGEIIIDSLNITGTVDVNIPGTYEITYTVTDSEGNTTIVVRTIIVE